MELNFDDGDLGPREVPFKLGSKDYVAREASAGGAATYRSAVLATHHMEDGKLVRLENTGDLEPLLVSLCVFRVQTKYACSCGNGVDCKRHPRVPLPVVRDWPSSTTKRLFEVIKEISPGLEERDTVEAIERRIKRDQEKLAALKPSANGHAKKEEPAEGEDNSGSAEQAQEDPAKNSPAGTTTS